jgi:hypothetical protein
MSIIYKDGSVLECCEVVFCGGYVIADGIYTVNINDIERIECV